MPPKLPSTGQHGCISTSSNCITWDGPDIPCIDLCRGDSVTEVVYKLGQEFCALSQKLSISTVQLSCLVSGSQTTPDPAMTLAQLLQLLIDKVCTIEDLVGTPTTPTPTPEALLTIAQCFRQNDSNGDPVTQLAHSEYTRRIGLEVCTLVSTVSQHTVAIAQHESRLTLLENAPAATYTPPKVVPDCVLPQTATEMPQVLEALESQFCQLRSVTGTPQQLATAVARQCAGLGSQASLSQPGTLSGIPGWASVVNTAADAINNMWIVLCDLRAAVVQNGQSAGSSCASVLFGFQAAASVNRQTLTLFFHTLSSIPGDYVECNQAGSQVIVSDSSGKSATFLVPVVANKANASGVDISLAGSGLNFSLEYTVTINLCVKKGTATCEKQAVQKITVPCAVVSGVVASFL